VSLVWGGGGAVRPLAVGGGVARVYRAMLAGVRLVLIYPEQVVGGLRYLWWAARR